MGNFFQTLRGSLEKCTDVCVRKKYQTDNNNYLYRQLRATSFYWAKIYTKMMLTIGDL